MLFPGGGGAARAGGWQGQHPPNFGGSHRAPVAPGDPALHTRLLIPESLTFFLEKSPLEENFLFFYTSPGSRQREKPRPEAEKGRGVGADCRTLHPALGFLSAGAPKKGPHLRFGAGRARKARRENLWVSPSRGSEGTGAEGATNSPFLGFDVRAPGAASSLLKFGKGKRSEVRRGTSQSSTFHF